MTLRSIFAINEDSSGTSLGLLALRASLGLTLFLKHGLEKLTGFAQMANGFPDPLHLGHRLSLFDEFSHSGHFVYAEEQSKFVQDVTRFLEPGH